MICPFSRINSTLSVMLYLSRIVLLKRKPFEFPILIIETSMTYFLCNYKVITNNSIYKVWLQVMGVKTTVIVPFLGAHAPESSRIYTPIHLLGAYPPESR